MRNISFFKVFKFLYVSLGSLSCLGYNGKQGRLASSLDIRQQFDLIYITLISLLFHTKENGL